MKKILLFTALFCLFGYINAFAEVTGAPHNSTNGIDCSDCHSYSLWWQHSPAENLASYNQISDDVCQKCHGEGESSIYAEGHTAVSIGGWHRAGAADWESNCSDCHDPHFQAQINWDSTDGSSLYLVTAKIKQDTINDNGDNTSSIEYENKVTNNSSWDNPTTWSNKTGADRGLILVVSLEEGESTFEINSANATNVTVQGVIDSGEFNGANFGLMYGQLIKDSIDYTGVDKDVKFFKPLGGYVSDNGDGLCQVCHTETLYFKNSGSGPVASDHSTELGASAGDCLSCHFHNEGFKPRDLVPPVITLTDDNVTLEKGDTFTEPGYSATDDIDGNVTASVVVNYGGLDTNVAGAYTATYDVSDSSGNNAVQKSRVVTVLADTVPPAITLTDDNVTMYEGDPYVEPGYSATDNIDGNVTSSVAIDYGGLNIVVAVAGTFTVTYDVSDSSGNDAEQKSREVTVVGNCDSSNVLACTSESQCTTAGGYWWTNNTCLGVPESETVTNAGQIWMDRNLGATVVADDGNATNPNAYGDWFQWGRGADGHQYRDSDSTSTLSSGDDPGHDDFILSSGDWRETQNDGLWQEDPSVNNPCPAGFRVPTMAEWNIEVGTWNPGNATGAMASPLRFPEAGYRFGDGSISSVGTRGMYWTSTVSTLLPGFIRNVDFNGGSTIGYNVRSGGMSIRCILN